MIRLFRYLKPYWWQIILLLISTATQVYCALRLPALMAEIINNGIVPNDANYIWQTGLKMAILAVLSALGALFASFFAAQISANFGRDIRRDVFAKIMLFNISDVEKFSTASLITRTTNDVNQVQDVTSMMLMLMLRAPLFCIIGIVMAFQTAPDMTWIIALSVAALLGITVTIMSLVVPKFSLFQKFLDKITLLTRENLTGLRVIRAFNNEKVEHKKFEETNEKMTKLLIFVDKILELQNPLINIIFNGTTLLCLWIGVSLLEKDFAYLGNMIAFAEYVGNIMTSFLMLSIMFVMFPRANVSAKRIVEVLNTKSKITWPKATIGVPSKSSSIEYKNVNFKYDDADENVLYDISFRSEAGTTTAFVGSTGSGKSALIELIPRFYETTSGSIEVNGIDIKKYAEDDLIKRIGFVPQRGVLFSGTINSNIKFGAPNATESQIKKAAEVSQSKEFIEKLPDKYNSHISQGGTNVSGGQKQRLSIARAICKNPDIFIFDDSFSALDLKTDKKLRSALKEQTKNAVVLLVAQRISTAKEADQIIVLANGRIVGKGTHDELLKSCKEYREIVKSQLSEKEYKEELKHARA